MPQRPDVRARLPGPARDPATGNHQGAADVAAGSAPAYPPEPARAAPASPADDGIGRPSPTRIPRAGTAKPPALLGLLARGLPDNVPEDRQGGATLNLPSPLPLLAPPPGAAPAAIAQEGMAAMARSACRGLPRLPPLILCQQHGRTPPGPMSRRNRPGRTGRPRRRRRLLSASDGWRSGWWRRRKRLRRLRGLNLPPALPRAAPA